MKLLFLRFMSVTYKMYVLSDMLKSKASKLPYTTTLLKNIEECFLKV